MREIKLNNGKIAIVDDEDYGFLSERKWQFDNGYAVTSFTYAFKKQKHVRMHRSIMGVVDPKIYVDHINHNRLDNRKNNLRLCSHKENSRNTSLRLKSESGYKGVIMGKNKKKQNYISQIVYNGKLKYLGSFNKPEVAALTYNQKAKELFGEYASLNRIKNNLKILDNKKTMGWNTTDKVKFDREGILITATYDSRLKSYDYELYRIVYEKNLKNYIALYFSKDNGFEMWQMAEEIDIYDCEYHLFVENPISIHEDETIREEEKEFIIGMRK